MLESLLLFGSVMIVVYSLSKESSKTSFKVKAVGILSRLFIFQKGKKQYFFFFRGK